MAWWWCRVVGVGFSLGKVVAELGMRAVSVNKFPIFDHLHGHSAKAATSNFHAATMH